MYYFWYFGTNFSVGTYTSMYIFRIEVKEIFSKPEEIHKWHQFLDFKEPLLKNSIFDLEFRLNKNFYS